MLRDKQWTSVDHTNATLRTGIHVRCAERRWRIANMEVFACPLESRKHLNAGLLLVGPEPPRVGEVLEFDETSEPQGDA